MKRTAPVSVSRRETLFLGVASVAAAVAAPAEPTPLGAVSNNPMPSFMKDTEIGDLTSYPDVHGGKGSLSVKWFPFAGASAPANFITYDIPPGASEGVHVHHLDNRNKEGPFDEYYYIVSGQGQMEIDGVVVPVKAGDHVHTPLDVAHGIENTHPSEHLKVFLTFITRTASNASPG